ncbi:MAG: hypothetical protein ABJQ71_15235 [Roseibium sp.]
MNDEEQFNHIFWNNIRAIGMRLDRIKKTQDSIDWFIKPQPRFDGKCPADLMVEGRVEDVLILIEELEGD